MDSVRKPSAVCVGPARLMTKAASASGGDEQTELSGSEKAGKMSRSWFPKPPLLSTAIRFQVAPEVVGLTV